MRFTPSLSQRVPDLKAEAVRANTEQRIGEIVALPIASAVVVKDVVMGDGATVIVPHSLGRRVSCFPSVVDGSLTPGVIQNWGATDQNGNPNDVTKSVSLRATGFGRAITVDLLMVPR